MPLPRPLDVALSHLTSGVRLGNGLRQAPLGPRPEQPLVLYEFEACPWCRRAREAVSVLDLIVDIRPCPKNGPRFREAVKQRGGRSMFPYLIDPNLGVEMYESADIVHHLFKHYGQGAPPMGLVGPFFPLLSQLASATRPGFGGFYVGDLDKAPETPLELYGVEASPEVRIVREALCSLELPYRLYTTPTGSARWEAVRARTGQAVVPFLIDPNTETELQQSTQIREYLMKTYR